MAHPEKEPHFSSLPLWCETVDTKNILPPAANWVWKSDTPHHHPDLKITVTNAFYGKPFLGAQHIYAEALRIQQDTGFSGEVPNATDSTGFDQLYQVPAGLTTEEYITSQQLAFTKLIQEALLAHGISANEVDLFLAAATMPIVWNFDEIWKKAGGIPQNIPSQRYVMACNSSGRAIADVLAGQYDKILAETRQQFSTHQPFRIMIAACDDPQRYSNEGSDPLSPQFFSSGATVLIFEYNPQGKGKGSFQLITHVNRSIEDGTQYLRARRTYDSWTDKQKEGLLTAQYLKNPTTSGSVEMSGKAGVMFKKYAVEVTKQLMSQYGKGPETIARVIVHHPSKAVFDSLQGTLIKEGFRLEQIHWVINEGNVPVATIPIALGRQLSDIQPNDRLIFLSFGAGGEYTALVAQAGSTALR